MPTSPEPLGGNSDMNVLNKLCPPNKTSVIYYQLYNPYNTVFYVFVGLYLFVVVG